MSVAPPPTPKWMSSPFGKKPKAAAPTLGGGYLDAIVGITAPSPVYPQSPPAPEPASIPSPDLVLEMPIPADIIETSDKTLGDDLSQQLSTEDETVLFPEHSAFDSSSSPVAHENVEFSYVIKPEIDLQSLANSVKASITSNHAEDETIAGTATEFASTLVDESVEAFEIAQSESASDFDSDVDVDGLDWRAFRAKLVLAEPRHDDDDVCDALVDDCGDLDGIGDVFFDRTTTKRKLERMTPLNPSQWAYDSGKNVEQGTVILGGVEQDFGFGLRQQYFHKAAILVLDHQEDSFTKAIILNRPTDFELEDDLNPGVRWPVWFGGDVQGIHSDKPDLVCLHAIESKEAQKASVPLMNGLMWTTFTNAKRLVNTGVANPEDFQVFCGYAGWGPGVLRSEVDKNVWYTVATDSQTLVSELAQIASSDPREAGLETWYMLMNMIGREEIARQHDGGFDDLMLKEWSLHKLLSDVGGGRAGPKKRILDGSAGKLAMIVKSPAQHARHFMTDYASGMANTDMVGCLVRASSQGRPPFLLQDQELHKSVILIVMDDDKLTCGAILNRPAAEGLDLPGLPKSRGLCCSQKVTLPLRFGGQYTLKNEEPLLWIHCSDKLRQANVGFPMSTLKGGIWKVKQEDVYRALRQGIATAEDFLAVTGVCGWTKEASPGGIVAELDAGTFELVPISKTQAVWNTLTKQKVLRSSTLSENVAIANEAWSKAGWDASDTFAHVDHEGPEDAGPCVFKSSCKVEELADEALASWIATFLLGVPAEAFS